ncbi:hypothetical protein GUJ93_ZPchr0007g5582 [Zizania palustris]|uniref:Uncharacterized protein n=1 Tax=Zizania palustris TaxID=103762 RepID=A0A8J5TFT6_ZIZPA|nr:hypothetical protein GUJ93_ZPchr0007g5582 [Zizania palustris]
MADAACAGAGDEGRNPALDPSAPPLRAPHFRCRIPSLAAVQPGCPAGSLHRVEAEWDPPEVVAACQPRRLVGASELGY